MVKMLQKTLGAGEPGVGCGISFGNQVFLGSWTINIRQEGRSQRSAPQRRHVANLRQCSHGVPRKPSGWDQGSD